MPGVTWDNLDWRTLDRLRSVFLSDQGPHASYWTSYSDLANYDFTFGQRIAWKWDAVIEELAWRGWPPPAGPVLDWGCGSGVAGRRVVAALGPERVSELLLFDRSHLAVAYAQDAARRVWPDLTVGPVDAARLHGDAPVGALVVSHVLGELDDRHLEQLVSLARRAEVVLWVEPGTYDLSRRLIQVREWLRDDFRLVAPCTHQATCGLLNPDNARHWCHYFADPPDNIMADPTWVRFADRAGIDLRRLPYSFLVLDRRPASGPESTAVEARRNLGGASRIIAEPRHFKGFARVLDCSAAGVRELTLQRRDLPGLFRSLKTGREVPVYRWELAGDRITGVLPPADVSGADPA